MAFPSMLQPALILTAFMTLGVTAGVAAQDLNDLRRDDRVDFGQPVDQGVEDVGAGLGRSGRIIDPGLRVPSGFQQVYRVPGRPGWLMRVDGALYALFRESVYDERGPLIPPGTVFHIGGLPTPLPEPSPELVARSHRLDARLKATPVLHRPGDPRILVGREESRPDIEAPFDPQHQPRPLAEALQGTIVDDGPYRRVRLRELLLAAAESEQRARMDAAR